MDLTPAIENLVLTGAKHTSIRDQAKQEGMTTLRESGLEKIRAGLMTIDEVLRETMIY